MKHIFAIIFILFITGCSKKDNNPVGGSPGTSGGDNTTIDNVNAANGDVSAAMDVNNKMHVAYFSFNLGVKYATNKSGSWAATMIHAEDAHMTTGYYNDIAVDQNGFVHMVYETSGMTQTDTSAIYYATNKSGVWVKTKIAFSVSSSFSGAGIAVTSTGKIHIVYGNSNMQLWYTHDLAGSWSGPVLIGSYWASVRPRLAADASNNIYVAYEHGGERALHLQTISAAGSLSTNTILDGGNSGEDRGWSPDITVNKTTGAVSVAYWNYDTDYLKLYNNGTITILDSLDWTDPSIITDNSGSIYVSYTDVVSKKLYLGTNKTGSWVRGTLPVSAVQRRSAVVAESNGKTHVLYNETGANALKVISQ